MSLLYHGFGLVGPYLREHGPGRRSLELPAGSTRVARHLRISCLWRHQGHPKEEPQGSLPGPATVEAVALDMSRMRGRGARPSPRTVILFYHFHAVNLLKDKPPGLRRDAFGIRVRYPRLPRLPHLHRSVEAYRRQNRDNEAAITRLWGT